MYSLKDKVSKKLSHLFSDSPSPRSASHTDQSQARSSPKEGKPLSNILSFVLHPTSFDGFRSDKHEDDIRTIPSLPIRWKSRSFPRYGRPLDSREGCDPKYENVEALSSCEGDGSYESAKKAACENKETNKSHEKNDDRGSEKSTSCSEIFETASGPHSAERSVHNLTDNSLFITSNLYDFFQSSLPNIVKGCQWVLLYSTVRDGISLRTLLRKSADLSGPCLLITGDRQGAVFGGLLECPLKPTAKRKYQGTNQTFVFTTLYGEPRLFRPTGVNRYFYLCLTDLLAMGGGGNFALCLDADLLTGTSGPCETFGNLCLAHDEEFEMKNVELWGFTHSSRYLT